MEISLCVQPSNAQTDYARKLIEYAKDEDSRKYLRLIRAQYGPYFEDSLGEPEDLVAIESEVIYDSQNEPKFIIALTQRSGDIIPIWASEDMAIQSP